MTITQGCHVNYMQSWHLFFWIMGSQIIFGILLGQYFWSMLWLVLVVLWLMVWVGSWVSLVLLAWYFWLLVGCEWFSVCDALMFGSGYSLLDLVWYCCQFVSGGLWALVSQWFQVDSWYWCIANITFFCPLSSISFNIWLHLAYPSICFANFYFAKWPFKICSHSILFCCIMILL